MIIDTIDNAGKYYKLSHGLRAGLEYLVKTDFSHVEDGRYDIADGVYVNVNTYITKPLSEGKFEAHKKYLDIQYIINGKEKIGVEDYAAFEPLIRYNEEKDIEFLSFKSAKPLQLMPLKEREFLVLYPSDAHMPQMAYEEPSQVRKAVVKVLL